MMKKKGNIDEMDQKILNILLKDAKVAYKDIAAMLKVSLGTIHIRIKKLESLKIIKRFTLNVDYYELGYTVSAFIGLIIDGKKHKEVLEELLKIKEIVELHHTTGKYHMFAKITCKDPKNLREILINKVNKIEGIEKTETTISLSELASRPGPVDVV